MRFLAIALTAVLIVASMVAIVALLALLARRLLADERDRRHVTGMLHQVLLTILAATAGIMAVLLR